MKNLTLLFILFYQFNYICGINLNGEFGKSYKLNISHNVTYVIKYSYHSEQILNKSVRIFLAAPSSQIYFPLFSIVRKGNYILTLQLPLKTSQKSYYHSVSRTLCSDYTTNNYTHFKHFDQNLSLDGDGEISVEIFTDIPNSIQLNILLTIENHYVLSIGKDLSFTVTPSQPLFFFFRFPPNVTSVRAIATSDDKFCSVMSVQSIPCPVFDLDENVRFEGIYQTMTTKASFILSRSNYLLDAFFLVFVVKVDDGECLGSGSRKTPTHFHPNTLQKDVEGLTRTKLIRLQLLPTLTRIEYVIAILTPLASFLFLYAFTFGILSHWYIRDQRNEFQDWIIKDETCPLLHSTSSIPNSSANTTFYQQPLNYNLFNEPFRECNNETYPKYYHQLPTDSEYSESEDQDTEPREFLASCPVSDVRLFEPDIIPNLTHPVLGDEVGHSEQNASPRTIGSSLKHLFAHAQHSHSNSQFFVPEYWSDNTNKNRFLIHRKYLEKIAENKANLAVADLAKKKFRLLNKKYILFHWNLFPIAIFYILPVIQLVFTYEKIINLTGNQDFCYFNLMCSNPFGNLPSFNNIFSNIGYILLGILFFVLVWRRDIIHKRCAVLNGDRENLYGIPNHFGIFYAMAIALCFEGILSSCYHVCPNYSNYQFDTSFMYIITCLTMLKIYQTRHPDRTASSYYSYFAFAIVVVISVIGLLSGNDYFWIIFSMLHVETCTYMSLQIYYIGYWKLDATIFHRIYHFWFEEIPNNPYPKYPDRLLLLILANLANIALSIYGLIYRPKNFPSYLLSILILNLLLYLAFYIIMKLRCGEKILLYAFVFILCSMICWAFACYFFLHGNISWQISPAQSREKNRDCILFKFYDAHDIWHFFSALALFFSYMTLLTLDDDLISVPRDKIPVF